MVILSASTLIPWRRGPCVYLWVRNEEVLYIGQTIDLLSRMGNHHVIGHADILLPTDEIHVMPCEDAEAAKVLERALIKDHQPPLNVCGTTNLPWWKRQGQKIG